MLLSDAQRHSEAGVLDEPKRLVGGVLGGLLRGQGGGRDKVHNARRSDIPLGAEGGPPKIEEEDRECSEDMDGGHCGRIEE